MTSNENRTVVVTSVVLSVISVMMAKMLKESDRGPSSTSTTVSNVVALNYVRKKRRTGKKITSNPRAHYPDKKTSQVPKTDQAAKTVPITSPSVVTPRTRAQPNPSPQKLSFIERLIQLKRIGVNSVKDFLEVGELNLRLGEKVGEKEGEKEEKVRKEEVGAVKVIWDSDGSPEYIVIMSPSYIPKSTPLQHSSIYLISEEDMRDRSLEKSSGKRWKRKAVVSSVSSSNGVVSSVLGSKHETCFYYVPFSRFHCRLISSNGRISRDLEYSSRPAEGNDSASDPCGHFTVYKKPEIDAWISYSCGVGSDGDKIYYMNVKEDLGINCSSVSKIHEYNVILYVDGGKGLIRKVPYFTGYTKYKLGRLPACLCYISGVRSTGVEIEQFVTWITP